MANVLLIEDDPDIKLIYSDTMSESGHQVKIIDDGIEAVQHIKEGTKYSIIFLDIMLPSVNGIEVLKAIREQYADTLPPVIIISNLDQQNIVDQAIKLGAKDYIIKSNILPSHLLNLIKQYTN